MSKTVTTGIVLLVGIISLKVVLSLLGTINELPLLPSLFQLVGLIVTGKFIIKNINSEQRQSTITCIKEQVQELGIEEQVQSIKEVVSNVVEVVKTKSTNITIPGWGSVDTSVPEFTEKVDNSRASLGKAFTSPKPQS